MPYSLVVFVFSVYGDKLVPIYVDNESRSELAAMLCRSWNAWGCAFRADGPATPIKFEKVEHEIH